MNDTTTLTNDFEFDRLTKVLGFTHEEAMQTIKNRRKHDARIKAEIGRGNG